jgi:hypothetical protein
MDVLLLWLTHEMWLLLADCVMQTSKSIYTNYDYDITGCYTFIALSYYTVHC